MRKPSKPNSKYLTVDTIRELKRQLESVIPYHCNHMLVRLHDGGDQCKRCGKIFDEVW